MKIEELRIPAPWGHIAVKSWNDPTYETIILSHGYADNSGSFDRIIPLLPKTYHYACFDLPGHGFSSNFPESVPFYYSTYLLALKVVAEYFKKESYVLMGHSLGAQFGLFFAQVYPELVSKVISLDALHPVPLGVNVYVGHIRNTYETYLTANKTRKTYTYDEAVDKVKNSRIYGTLTREAAEDLIKRMVEKTDEGKYVFTDDRRTMIMPAYTHEFNIQLFNNVPVKCPVLILLTRNNGYLEMNSKLREHFEKIGFIVKYIGGDHHVHQTAPKEVADLVTTFLLRSSKY